jgi:hypothetical protein
MCGDGADSRSTPELRRVPCDEKHHDGANIAFISANCRSQRQVGRGIPIAIATVGPSGQRIGLVLAGKLT